MSLKVTGVYFSASSAGPGPGKMKATIRASRPLSAIGVSSSSPDGHGFNGRTSHHSQSLDYLHLNFEEKRKIIASSLSLVDFLNQPKTIGNFHLSAESVSQEFHLLICQLIADFD